MFLLALQFLYGRDCVVLLRGIMEFSNTSEEYGFKENLTKRFGEKEGPKLWDSLMKVFARLPLNCRVLYAVYCSSGGFNDGDIKKKDKDVSFTLVCPIQSPFSGTTRHIPREDDSPGLEQDLLAAELHREGLLRECRHRSRLLLRREGPAEDCRDHQNVHVLLYGTNDRRSRIL